MSTNIETSCMIEGHATGLHSCEKPMPDIGNQKSRSLANRIGYHIIKRFWALQGYEFRIARTEEEIAAANELRESIFSSVGYSTDLSHHHDELDSHSVIFICYYRNKMVGTLRLIDASDCQVFAWFNVNLPGNVQIQETVELGGLAIERRHRGKGSAILIGLLNMAYNYSFTNDLAWWLCGSNERQYKLFKEINESCEILEQHPPDPLHLKNREVLKSYFEKYAGNTKIYVFDLTKVSYYQNIKRVVQRGFFKSKRKRSRKRSRSIALRGIREQATCLSN